jgi:hypothetical protein
VGARLFELRVALFAERGIGLILSSLEAECDSNLGALCLRAYALRREETALAAMTQAWNVGAPADLPPDPNASEGGAGGTGGEAGSLTMLGARSPHTQLIELLCEHPRLLCAAFDARGWLEPVYAPEQQQQQQQGAASVMARILIVALHGPAPEGCTRLVEETVCTALARALGLKGAAASGGAGGAAGAAGGGGAGREAGAATTVAHPLAGTAPSRPIPPQERLAELCLSDRLFPSLLLTAHLRALPCARRFLQCSLAHVLETLLSMEQLHLSTHPRHILAALPAADVLVVASGVLGYGSGGGGARDLDDEIPF